MRSGSLRHRVTIQNRTTTRDDYGGEVEVWNDFATKVLASVEPLSGRELVAAQAAQSEVRTRIKMRYRPGLDSSMRILFNGKIYNISEIIDLQERHKELQIMAGSGLNQG